MSYIEGLRASMTPENNESQFVPWATMFKLPEPDSGTVRCVACGAEFTLSDLLTGELEEDSCPRCKTFAGQYWANKPHRVLGYKDEAEA